MVYWIRVLGILLTLNMSAAEDACTPVRAMLEEISSQKISEAEKAQQEKNLLLGYLAGSAELIDQEDLFFGSSRMNFLSLYPDLILTQMERSPFPIDRKLYEKLECYKLILEVKAYPPLYPVSKNSAHHKISVALARLFTLQPLLAEELVRQKKQELSEEEFLSFKLALEIVNGQNVDDIREQESLIADDPHVRLRVMLGEINSQKISEAAKAQQEKNLLFGYLLGSSELIEQEDLFSGSPKMCDFYLHPPDFVLAPMARRSFPIDRKFYEKLEYHKLMLRVKAYPPLYPESESLERYLSITITLAQLFALHPLLTEELTRQKKQELSEEEFLPFKLALEIVNGRNIDDIRKKKPLNVTEKLLICFYHTWIFGLLTSEERRTGVTVEFESSARKEQFARRIFQWRKKEYERSY